MAKIIEYLQQAKEIADTIDNITLKAIIVNLHSEILTLQEENLHLKEKANQKNSFDMIFQNNMYYNRINETTMAGPYCTACWDTKKQAVRLHFVKDGFYRCPSCKMHVSLKSSAPVMGMYFN